MRMCGMKFSWQSISEGINFRAGFMLEFALKSPLILISSEFKVHTLMLAQYRAAFKYIYIYISKSSAQIHLNLICVSISSQSPAVLIICNCFVQFCNFLLSLSSLLLHYFHGIKILFSFLFLLLVLEMAFFSSETFRIFTTFSRWLPENEPKVLSKHATVSVKSKKIIKC